MFKEIKRFSYFITAFILVFIIYQLSITLLKIGFNSASSNIFFVTLGIYLCIPILKYNKSRSGVVVNEIEHCSKMEKSMKSLKKKMTPLQRITLKVNDKIVAFDDIVVSKKGVFNIVECSLTGNIEINKDNKWYRKTRKSKELVSSPITQIRENREILNKVLKEDQILDVIVMINDRVDIDGEEDSAVPIVRYDEIATYINEYDCSEEYDDEELYQRIYPIIEEEKDLEEVVKNYHMILDNRWQFRSRLFVVVIFFALYILNIISLS
ncbi:nuclease-related domain-containing protein [Clostridium paraputrificum]|uniref:nuclease-related domain-containing protein n=1 Tax=Clostridium paraputrificum TaxID=29363 RepID=UPI003D32AFF5